MKKSLLLILILLSWVAFQPSSALAAGINRVRYDERPDGTVIQTIELTAPSQTYQLNFRYCNGQTCGNPDDPDLNCYVNRYNPDFTLPPRSLSITPPPGAFPLKMYLKSGSLPGFTGNFGYYDSDHPHDWNSQILSGQPTVEMDGTTTLNLKQPHFMSAMSTSPLGRVCGLSEEEYAAFKKQYGSESDDNFYQSSIKIAIVWSKPTQSGFQDTTITLDGTKKDDHWVYVPPTTSHPLVPQANTLTSPYLSQDPKLSATVPTLLSALLSQLGSPTSPAKLAADLEKAGVATKAGFNWSGLKTYLSTTNQPTFTARDVTAATALEGAARGQSYLTTLSIPTKTGRQESSLFLTGYTSQRDQVKLVTTAGQTLTISTTTYLKGQPWIMEIKPTK